MEGLEGYFAGPAGSRLLERVGEAYRRAYDLARRLGARLVGRITRYRPVETGPGGTVIVEVAPEEYFTGGHEPVHRVGDYLAAVDPKTLRVVLLRVQRITRQDLLSMIGAEPPVSGYTGEPDPSGAATSTLIVAEPLVEAPPGLDEPPVPASTSIEPQAPVFEPKREVLERLLSLPGEGVLLGVLAGPWGPVPGGLPVRLPYKALLQHVLIVGTTGSGKTSLAKNMAASLYSEPPRRGKPVLVVIDLNQDYVQLPFPGSQAPDWALPAYARVRPPRGLVVVVPVSRDMLERVALEGGDPCSGMRELYEWYARTYIEPVAGSRVRLAEMVGGGLPRGVVEAGGRRITLVPYSIDTTRSRTEEILGLLPGLTLLARELLKRLRWRFYKHYEWNPPLPLVAAGLLDYLTERRTRRQSQGRGDGPGREEDDSGRERLEEALEAVMEYAVATGLPEGASVSGITLSRPGRRGEPLQVALEYIVESLRRMYPSDRTVEALYRRLAGLLEGGLVDVMLVCRGEARLLPEPGWEDIIDLASRENAPVVVDLKPASESGMGSYEGPRAVAYRMLQKLSAWKQEAYAERRETRPVLVLIDEAHQFFPQEKGPSDEAEANRQVAAMISRVARLGRARGIGLVFATHSPRDLHDIILQLANTKIVLRTERGQLERLQLPGDIAPMVPRFPDRMMAVMGHSYREGYVLAVTPPPLVRHYDVSALL